MDPPGLQGQKMHQAAGAPRRYDGEDGSPLYDPSSQGHYGAAAQLAASGHAPPPDMFVGPWQNCNQGLTGNYRDILNTYWQNQITKLEHDEHDYKLHQLPLARIKKVMKADPEVKMISAEAPILFAKGCDIFITELTMRAWMLAEENKRRTLQRSDIASALSKSDMFDFLIDIVPRDDAHSNKRGGQGSAAAQASAAAVGAGPIQGGVAPHQMPSTDFMGAHLPPQDFRPPPALFTAPGQGDPSLYAQNMFDQGVYGPYGQMAQQQMYPVGQRGPDPTGAGDPSQYRAHDAEGDADAEGERDEYGA
ncbi:nuclear transcription factor Y subunit C-3 [Sporormia fimetaria CBS 119925]|uniref:Nuclear transcription factor Y subunit C-3 n=1 Tax=Sporormia fimetaria CBS 119925 TaxID=1340428 RepID=A0A6A6VL61_9PLEO|nr:nuclear transcription factor Y subunit C-3 [Sporormia fimetaria CBS 119925]